MEKDKIDLSDIKEYDLDKTSSFTDLMSRSERKAYQRAKTKLEEKIDEDKALEQKRAILDMMNEDDIPKKKKQVSFNSDIDSTKKFTKIDSKKEDIEENLSKTKTLEITRQLKLNLEETKEENIASRRNGISTLNVIGVFNLICIAFYIYTLVFTNYQNKQNNYLLTGGIIVLLVLLFGLSIVTRNKTSKFFRVLNILTIIGFIGFNVYVLIH